MEEVPDSIPEEELPILEEVEEIPAQLPLKRQKNAAAKVTCEGCGKSMAPATYKYSHRCKARAPDAPVPAPEPPPAESPPAEAEKPKRRVDRAKLAAALKDDRPSLTERESIRPVKQRAVIKRTPEYVEPEPPYQPNQAEIFPTSCSSDSSRRTCGTRP